MQKNELDIPILSYLDGEMNADEKIAFELNMSKNELLKQEVAEYKTIQQGVKQYSKNKMKADLKLVQEKVNSTQKLKKYKPSIKPSSNFYLIVLFIKLLILGLLAFLAFLYFNEKPKNSVLLQSIHNKMHYYDTLFKPQHDTVWTIVPSTKVKNGDTVIIKNQKELEEFKKNNVTESNL